MQGMPAADASAHDDAGSSGAADQSAGGGEQPARADGARDASKDVPTGDVCSAQVEFLKADLARRLGIQRQSIGVISVESATWDSRCLGIDYGPVRNCFPSREMIPGCLILLETTEYVYEYHTDQGSRFELQLPPRRK